MVAKSIARPLPSATGTPWARPDVEQVFEFLKLKGAGPKPARWQDRNAWEMANAHHCMLDLIKRAYLFAPEAEKGDDLANFLGFAEVAVYQLWSHHHFEEESWFPAMQKVAPNAALDGNIAEHHLFDKPLDAAWLYVRLCRARLNPAPPAPAVPEPPIQLDGTDLLSYGLDPAVGFSAQAFRAHFDKSIGVMVQHLGAEIDTIGPAYTEQIGEKQLQKIDAMVLKHLQGYDPSWFLCSAFISWPIETCKEMISLPYPVRRLLLPFVWSRKYWGYWQYGAHPQNLTFAGTA